MRLGRSQDKFAVGRGLLQGLQEGIKGILGYLMHLINYINFKSTFSWLISDVFDNLAHLIDATIRGPINFKNIHRIAITDFGAICTLAAWIWGRTILTVESLGKDPGCSGFPNATDTGEQITVSDPARQYGVYQDSGNMPLPNNFLKLPGTPFSR
jgi:hypothetical protein